VTNLAAGLRALAERLAREAGQMVRAGRVAGITGTATKSSRTDMVTEFDRAAEALIVDGLRRARPDDAIVGEEGTDAAGTSGIRWLIDPIDGTTNFLYGLPGFAVSVAALDDDGALAGAVYVPVTDEMFSAAVGAGATLGGQAIRCGTTTDLADALVATGFSYLPERRRTQAARLGSLLPSVRDIRRLGAASVDLCYVAAGRFDAYFEQWLGPWDIAAGELIAREAGCRSGAFDGGPAGPSELLVAAPQLFDQMVGLLRTTGPHDEATPAPGIM
jgi:fructose-1,6-bisphosphatase/inositol monophosphatase family enzyme